MDSSKSDERPISSKVTIKTGKLRFEPEQRTASFLRVRVENTHEGDSICKSVWDTLQQKFELKLPGLLISVIGKCDDTKRPELERIIQEGLVTVAAKTGAWIITDATDTRLTALVGEAVQDFKCTLKDSSEHDLPLLIGISTTYHLAQRDEIREATKKTYPVKFEKNPADGSQHLERNHTHFLLIRRDGKPGQFRSEFEKYISTKSKSSGEKKQRKNVDRYALPLSPPKVLFLVGGGMEDLEAVCTAVTTEHCPVIVVATSGGAADVLATMRDKSKQDSVLKAEVAKLPSDKKTPDKAWTIPQECRNTDSLKIFYPGKGNLVEDIKNTVLSAKKREAGAEQTSENGNKAADKNHVLSLAIKWHCWDYAKKNLLIPDNKVAWEPELLFDALLEDQSNIINYFLERDEKLEDLFKKKHLEDLYNSEKYPEMRELLRSSAHFFKKHRKETFSLSYINKVLVHLMRDDSFSFDSAFKKEKESPKKNGSTDVDKAVHQTQLETTKLHERDLFLWAILFNRREMSLLFWRYGLDHLGGALCASALLKRLSVIAEGKEMSISKDLAKHSEEWESLASTVLTKCYSLNEDLTHRLLVRKLTRWGPPKSSGAQDFPAVTHDSEPGCEPPGNCDFGRPKREPSVLLMAQTYQMMKFVGHPACQDKLRGIWKGFMACDTHEFLIFLCMFLPIFLPRIHFRVNKKKNSVGTDTAAADTDAEEPSKPDDSDNVKHFLCRCLCDILHFYNAPITKFFANIVANLVYLAIFSYFLLVELDEGPLTVLEYITWAWLFTMFLEEIRQMLFTHQRSVRYRLFNWIVLPWNQFDVTLYVVFNITVVLRFVLPIYGAHFKWIRWFYSITLVLCFIRFTQYFYGVKSIGPKVIMIQKMVKDMVLFLAILLVFVIGFGIAYHANIFPNSSPNLSIIVNIFYFPYFQIFGELFLDNLRGDGEADCTRNETVWRQNPLKRCPEDGGYIVLLMLGAYMIVTNILLVNLLIAMFSHTFQTVQEKSLEVWSYYRLSLVHEYFSRPSTVPPFIVIHYIYRSIRAICCNRTKGFCKEYHAFRRDYKNDERQLTLFERTAVKKIFVEMGKKEPTINMDILDTPKNIVQVIDSCVDCRKT